MRQRTNWEFNALAPHGLGIRVGRVHNPNWDYKPDIIRLQIRARGGSYDLHMTVDEAVVICAGLTKVVAKEMWERRLDVRKQYED